MTLEDHTDDDSVSFCGRHSNEECFSESFFDLQKMVLVIVVTLLFSFHHLITARLSNMVKSFLISRRVNPELLRLGNEIRRLKAQLATISPTSEFSAYFKTERVLKKAGEEYEAAVAEERREGPSEVKVEIIVKIALQAVGLVLLHCVSGIYAFCIPSIAFWPFNILLRFPSIWSVDHQCGGQDLMLTPVSMFVFIYCIVFTVRKLCT